MIHNTSKILESNKAVEIFSDFVKNYSAKILDLGSGNWYFNNQLKERGYQDLYGADIEDYGIPNVVLANINSERLPFADGTFDAVTGWEVIEHLENPYFSFREIFRVLKPGGYFIFSMPNAFHWSNKAYFMFTGNFLRWNLKNDHRFVFTHAILEKACRPYFEMSNRRYAVPEFWQGKFQGPWRRFNNFFRQNINHHLPENQAFSHFVVYILKKKN